MKIGMITFHSVPNLGANLQAFALNRYINQNINRCEIIDFIPNSHIVREGNFKRSLRVVKNGFLYPFLLNERKFKEFQKKNYILSSQKYKGDEEIFASPPRYDILISGSDQILNATLSGDSKAFYLGFDHDAKKISYASSFGRKDISNIEKELIKTWLPHFSDISVREESASEIIEGLTGKSSKLVMDPVFLLGTEEWRRLAGKIKTPKKYILVYAMEISQELLDTVEAARKLYNLPILTVYGCCGSISGTTRIKWCGPQEFISYIDNAELVITNSFHGTAFSILLKRKFLCVAHSKRNERLINITNLCSKTQKLITAENNSIDNNIIDGNKALTLLDDYINSSKEYLENNCRLGYGD